MSTMIGASVAKTIRALKRPGCPRDAICHHLGVHADSVAGATIGISDRDGMLLVTIYHCDAKTVRSASTHKRRVRAVAAALGCSVKETWNGNDGPGVSVVLDRRAPKALVRSTDNYARMPDVFRPTDDERKNFAAFDDWFAAALRKQQAAQDKP